MHSALQAAVFGYTDLLGSLWEQNSNYIAPATTRVRHFQKLEKVELPKIQLPHDAPSGVFNQRQRPMLGLVHVEL